MAVYRRGVLSVLVTGLGAGCLGSLQDEDDELRTEWEESDEVPERDEVNREGDYSPTLLGEEVSSFMPAYAPLLSSVSTRTNTHYDITIEAEGEIDVFVVEDETGEDESVVTNYTEDEFSYIPEYSAEGVQSHSAYVHVPDGEDYGLIVDFHDVDQDRRHLRDPIPIEGTIDEYYFLPYETYRDRRTDD